MESQSRRDLIKSCLYLSLTGIGGYILSFLDGCKRSERYSIISEGVERGQQMSDLDFEPAYVKLHRSGELKKRGERLWQLMESCRLCPRMCEVDRLKGERGVCRATSQLLISSFHPHFGEERPLVGRYGSGTIFFTHCNLRCVFCINWEISHEGEGDVCSIQRLAQMMLRLQKMGCHNINVVTPTHYLPHILLALDISVEKGLRLPIVYNTCGWELVDIIKMLDGIVDIYMPDFKYSDGKMAAKYSAGAANYPDITKMAILEMHRQVGTAHPAKDGLLYRGLLIRHLVMPNNVSGSKEVLRWISENLPQDTYINIMSQYTPVYKAKDYPEINRRITAKEYDDIVRYAKDLGLTNLDIQG